MGGVPVKHHTRSKVGKRRSHLARKPLVLSPCPKCKAPTLSHRVCPACGYRPAKKRPAAK